MKLKKALKIARKIDGKYIAVDKSNVIYSYNQFVTNKHSDMWAVFKGDIGQFNYIRIGMYTGSKNWKETLRKVK